MRKLLIFLLAFMIVGSASGLPMFGPAQGFRNPGNVEVGGTLSVGGANIVAGTVTYDDIIEAAYVNETAINTSVAALTLAAYLNETAINSSVDTLTSGAYMNETAINSSIAALLLASYVNETAINSSVSALTEAAYVNETAINSSIGSLTTGAYLNETAINSSVSALTAAAYLNETVINATAADVALGQTAQNTTLANLAYAQTWQNTTLTDNGLAHTAINSTAIANKQSDYINTTAINSSIAALVVPLATFDYDANSVDQGLFTASGGWVLTAVKMTPRVLGTSESAVSVMVKICDSGEAPTSGDNMLSGTLDLKTGADTPQSGTVSAGTIANGKIVALDFTGTLTSAVGTITLYGTRG